jgi:arginase
MASSEQLKRQVHQALKDGYYPIVLGGDHSQAIGSIAGMKRMFPNGKVIWIDAHIDANTPTSSPSRNAHGMPLAYLSGLVDGYKHWKCFNMESDICYFGIRSYEEEEAALINENGVLVFDSAECHVNRLDNIHAEIHQYFKHKANRTKYWISFDIDGVDSSEFKSTGTDEGNGLSLEFTKALFERMVPQTIGMDFTEVNFELTQGAQRKNDEETFRDILELVCHQVNQPVFDERSLRMPEVDSVYRKFDKN